MSEHRRFNKDESRKRSRFRHEWVALDCGDLVVRELSAADSLTIQERAARPAIDPRGGIDRGESILWQMLLSCYEDDQPEAARVFNPDSREDVQTLYTLRMEEFAALATAIARVNGKDPEEAEVMRDFSAVRPGGRPSP